MIRGRSDAWGRTEEWGDIKPLNQPGWENVWPLVGGQLGDKSEWLLDALWREHEELEGRCVQSAPADRVSFHGDRRFSRIALPRRCH